MVNVSTRVYKKTGENRVIVSDFWIDDINEIQKASIEFGRMQHFKYGDDVAWGYKIGDARILITDFTL